MVNTTNILPTWTHTVLEMYEPDTGWPDSGTAADWIDSGNVGFCQGKAQDLVLFTPLSKIIKWKFMHFLTELWWSITWRFRKSEELEWDDNAD